MFKKIWIGCDHGGYAAKKFIVDYLTEYGYEVTDIGTDSTDIVRYPYYAARVAQAVVSKKADAGILICSTGIGMSIIANKFKGVRAALCTSGYMASMTRRHNDSNVLCLGGKITGEAELIDIVEKWLISEFEGGRHLISLGMIAEGEEAMISQSDWKPEKNF